MKASDPTQDQLTRWINEGLKDCLDAATYYLPIQRGTVDSSPKPQDMKEFIEWEKKEHRRMSGIDDRIFTYNPDDNALSRLLDQANTDETDYDEYYPPLNQYK